MPLLSKLCSNDLTLGNESLPPPTPAFSLSLLGRVKVESQEDNSQFIILPLSRPQHTQLTPKGTFFLAVEWGRKLFLMGPGFRHLGGEGVGFLYLFELFCSKT